MATPHANFISLRSGGSDSANSSWIKPGRSYDYDNCDSNDIFSSSSLQQSQFLQPPSLLNLPNKICTSNQAVLSTSQRPINPISSLRRHMFVNSRRAAQTTIGGGGDSINIDNQSYELVNSMSIASTNQLASNQQPLIETQTNIQTINECEDPNLLNPSWIPLIVRRTLLEMHERAILSKSDSNIKSKYRSSNHLLHSPTANLKSTVQHKVKAKKKKPLSLQNSQDKTTFYSTNTPNNNNNRGSNYINTFYEELRQKFFVLNSNSHKAPPSTSNTMSTNVSSAAFKQDSKLNSIESNQINSQTTVNTEHTLVSEIQTTTQGIKQDTIKENDNQIDL